MNDRPRRNTVNPLIERERVSEICSQSNAQHIRQLQGPPAPPEPVTGAAALRQNIRASTSTRGRSSKKVSSQVRVLCDCISTVFPL